MERQQEYLRLLQERNRLKKALTEKSEDERLKEEKEKGFSTNFRGANAPKDATSKALDKPVVKVQKALPMDMMRRLAGENENNAQVPSKKRWTTESAYRRDGGSNDEEEPDASFTHQKSDPEASCVKDDETADASHLDVNQALAKKIQHLNEEQKKALLDLLLVTEVVTPRESRFVKEEQSLSVANTPADFKVTAPSNPPQPSWTSRKLRLRLKIYSTWDDGKYCTLQALRCRTTLASSEGRVQYLDVLPAFKTQIYSGLSAVPSSLEVYRKLPSLISSSRSSSVTSGEYWKGPISLTSPLEIVFEGSLQDSLSSMTMGSQFSSIDAFLEATNFLVWNGFYEDGTHGSNINNAGPAKDVDFYLDEKCVWSGQIPYAGVLGDVAKANSSVLATPWVYETQPSISINVCHGSVDSSKQKSPQRASKVVSQGSDQGRILVSQSAEMAAGTPTRLSKRDDRGNQHQSSQSKPDWLQQESGSMLPQSRNDVVFASSSPSRQMLSPGPSPDRAVQNADSAIPSKKAVLLNRRARASRHSNLGTNNDLDVIPEGSDVPANSHHPRLQSSLMHKNGSAASLKTEEQLRRSMDAVRHAEQFNLNRLEKSRDFDVDGSHGYVDDFGVLQEDDSINLDATSAAFLESLKMVGKTSAVPSSSSLVAEASLLTTPVKRSGSSRGSRRRAAAAASLMENTDDHLRQLLSPATPVSNPSSHGKGSRTQIPQQLPTSDIQDASSPSNQHRLEKRAANIGQFSAKLNTALSDINGILAGLPRKPSLQAFPTVTETNDPTPLANSSPLRSRNTDTNESVFESSSKLPVNKQTSNSAGFSSTTASNVMPQGSLWRLIIYTTHGDNNYVGLNGLECFDVHGRRVSFLSSAVVEEISAIPPDLTVLPGYEEDPRQAQNLLDGVNETKDDLHQWLAPQLQVAFEYLTKDQAQIASPYTGAIALISLRFTQTQQTLSALRIYNFNKSRTHNQRGVKRFALEVDGRTIFQGELKKATGLPTDAAQTLFFTQDEKVLQRIQQQTLQNRPPSPEELNLEESMISVHSRPKTAVSATSQTTDAALAGYNQSSLENTESLQLPLHTSGSLDATESRMLPLRRPPPTDDRPPTTSMVTAIAANITNNVDQDSLQSSSEFLALLIQETSSQPIQQQPSQTFAARAEKEAEARSLGNYLQQQQQQQQQQQHQKQPSLSEVAQTSSSMHTQKMVVNTSSGSSSESRHFEHSLCDVTHIHIDLISTWGDTEYVGLAGVDVLLASGQVLPLRPDQLRCEAAMDSSSFHNGYGDQNNSCSDRSDLRRLLPSVQAQRGSGRDTADSSRQWLVAQDHDRRKVTLEIDLRDKRNSQSSSIEVAGLRIWNYNGPGEDVLRGARHVQVTYTYDQGRRRLVTPLLLRCGPGYDGLHFGQRLSFDDYLEALSMHRSALSVSKVPSYITPKQRQTYESVSSVHGLSFVFTCHRNHGDLYYLGLDRIDFLNDDMQVLDVAKLATVGALPDSVRVLSGQGQDPRVPSALFTTTAPSAVSSSCGWLAPLTQTMTAEEKEVSVQRVLLSQGQSKSQKASTLPSENSIFVHFHVPVRVAAIRIWNYSRTKGRGVKDFSVSVDGNIVFMGNLLSVDEEKKGDGVARDQPKGVSRGQIMVFSSEPRLLNQYKDLLINSHAMDQDVLCINERQVMVRSKTMYSEPAMPLDQVDIQQRPATSFVRR